MDRQPPAKIRALLDLRMLKKRARELAKQDLESGNGSKNPSAWLSRETHRHYGKLLAAHVEAIEKQRDEKQTDCHEMQGEVENLRSEVSKLEKRLLELKQSELGEILDLAIMPHER